jgi:DNA-binding NarL/FixJ family response regulator
LLQDVTDGTRAVELMAGIASLCRSHRILVNKDPAAGQPAVMSDASLNGLTWREREVLQLVAKGLSNAAIALALGVSVHTVRNHVQHILGKSRTRNRAAAVSLALRGGML